MTPETVARMDALHDELLRSIGCLHLEGEVFKMPDGQAKTDGLQKVREVRAWVESVIAPLGSRIHDPAFWRALDGAQEKLGLIGALNHASALVPDTPLEKVIPFIPARRSRP